MLEWFNALDSFEKVYWLIAIPATLVFLFVLITTFIGGDVDTDVDVDMDMDADADMDGGAGFQFITFKNLVGFFTIFAWTGIACVRSGMGTGLTIVISVICGLLMMTAMATLYYFLTRLVEDGTMRMKNAIGRTGEVYLPIKGNNGGFGKVQITIQGSLHEIQAVTEDEEDLPVGTVVKVKNVIDNHILLVTKNLS